MISTNQSYFYIYISGFNFVIDSQCFYKPFLSKNKLFLCWKNNWYVIIHCTMGQGTNKQRQWLLAICILIIQNFYIFISKNTGFAPSFAKETNKPNFFIFCNILLQYWLISNYRILLTIKHWTVWWYKYYYIMVVSLNP